MSWQTHVTPLLLTVALWWGSTAVIARLITGHPQHYPRFLRLFSLIGVIGLAAIMLLRQVTTGASAIAALIAALAVWSWIEITFLTGRVTGFATRPADPCSRAAAAPQGFLRRATAAIAAILWHELLIIGTVIVVALTTLGGSNDLALLVLLLLWLMRSSAKLNLFLGVRNLGEGFLPPHLQHLLEFMRQRRMNPLMPLSLLLGGSLSWYFGSLARDATSLHDATAATILATLSALATLEHLLMILPVPAEALWRWSLAHRRSSP